MQKSKNRIPAHRRAAGALIGAILLAGSLSAAPLREADLPENTAWFVHTDFDALRAGELGKALFETELTPFPGNDALRQFEKETAFSAQKNLAGVTAFGDGESAHNAIIARHDFSNEKLVTWLEARKAAHAEIAAGETKLPSYRLSVPTRTGTKDVYIVFPREGVVVLAASPEILSPVRARLDAAKTESALPEEVRKLSAKNPFLLGALNAEEVHERNAHIRIGHGARRAAFAAGNADKNVLLEFFAETKNEEGAKRIGALAGKQGAVATVSGNTVLVRIEKPASEIIEKIRECAPPTIAQAATPALSASREPAAN